MKAFKKNFSVIVLLVLMLMGFSSEAQQNALDTAFWQTLETNDEFGDPNGKHFVVNTSVCEGSYNNTYNFNTHMTVNILVTRALHISFHFTDDNRYPVGHKSGYAGKYTKIHIKDENGKVHKFSGTGSALVMVSLKDRFKMLKLFDLGGELKVSVMPSNDTHRFKFTMEDPVGVQNALSECKTLDKSAKR